MSATNPPPDDPDVPPPEENEPQAEFDPLELMSSRLEHEHVETVEDEQPPATSDRRHAFREWRRSRPFWAGLLIAIGGAELIIVPLASAPLPVVVHAGIAGISSWLVGLLLALIGILLWLQPAQRTFYGIVAVLLGLAAFVTSNFGGFGIGMILALVGGSMGFAWAPGTPEKRNKGKRRRSLLNRATSNDGGKPSGSHALALAVVPAMLAAPFAHSMAAPDKVCLPLLCPPSSHSPSPSPTHGSPSKPPPTLPGGGGGGSSGGSHKHKHKHHKPSKADEKKVEKFRPKRKDLPVHSASLGRARVSVQNSELTADKLEMWGLHFDGVVAMPTAAGKLKMLEFSMDRSAATNSNLVVKNSTSSTSTKDTSLTLTGNIKFYTTKLHVKLYGIPLTFTPKFPPPLVLSHMVFTDAQVQHTFVEAGAANVSNLVLSVRPTG